VLGVYNIYAPEGRFIAQVVKLQNFNGGDLAEEHEWADTDPNWTASARL
jgi:hypothetical protein